MTKMSIEEYYCFLLILDSLYNIVGVWGSLASAPFFRKERCRVPQRKNGKGIRINLKEPFTNKLLRKV